MHPPRSRKARTQRASRRKRAAEAARTGAVPADGDAGEAIRRATHEREGLVAQISERAEEIARLQREVADKTDRLGRLAKEMGELKAKGLGKIFR